MSRLDELYRERTRIACLIEREETARAAAGPVHSTHILRAAAELYTVTVEEILSPNRDPRIVMARHAVCWLLRARGVSFPGIGRIVSRDHTTVMHACRKVDADPAVRALLWPLLGKVGAA